MHQASFAGAEAFVSFSVEAAPVVIEGKVSSKHQVTIPVLVREALGIEPGDTIRFEIDSGSGSGSVRVTVVRTDIADALEALWAKHDLDALDEEIGGYAVAYVRERRGWGDVDDER
ncbi:MAG: AbrB/MazE/SpoVT family DNA-binding domain-containing protein [Trueperaceae bacterium]|nr:AbrB/MazE/SpoVT family DNA-binding domain-containing protein [Trueperaceae bacterium]